jgi:hypothetical protein
MFKAFLRGLAGGTAGFSDSLATGFKAGVSLNTSNQPSSAVEGSEGYTVNKYADGSNCFSATVTDNATGQVRHWDHSDGCAQTGIAPSDRVW